MKHIRLSYLTDLAAKAGLTIAAFWALGGAQAQTISYLYKFTAGSDGYSPYSYLVADRAGNLYGSASGGTGGGGVIFKLTPTGTFSVVHSIAQNSPIAYGAISAIDKAGNFYGTTPYTGPSQGSVFKVAPSGQESVLYGFTGGSDGSGPNGVIVDRQGNLYGTTDEGGDLNCQLDPNGCGTVFKLARDGTFSVLHAFTAYSQSVTDGSTPFSLPALDKAGNLYCTTAYGGDTNQGTIFKITPSGTYSIITSFSGSQTEQPAGRLTLDPQGNFYGTSFNGGVGFGDIWRVTPDGSATTLHSLNGGSEGAFGYAGVARDRKGNLYGPTASGGFNGTGGVDFKVAPDGAFTVLHTFTGVPHGLNPIDLVLGTSGNLLGTTYYGGNSGCTANLGCGTIYSLATH